MVHLLIPNSWVDRELERRSKVRSRTRREDRKRPSLVLEKRGKVHLRTNPETGVQADVIYRAPAWNEVAGHLTVPPAKLEGVLRAEPIRSPRLDSVTLTANPVAD